MVKNVFFKWLPFSSKPPMKKYSALLKSVQLYKYVFKYIGVHFTSHEYGCVFILYESTINIALWLKFMNMHVFSYCMKAP